MIEFPKIVVAGASGYIGRAILPNLLVKFPKAQITALSRTEQHSDDERVQWKACDLFSLKALEAAVPARVDLALYLVHSMGPTAQLDQGSFADYDLILADNFARVLKRTGILQLIYLGGLIPQSGELSLHLRSRLEVEQTFQQFELPTTIFRAGLILGEAGSSSQILLKLVKRLPLMICPAWTQTLTSPVDLESVLQAISTASLNEKYLGVVYDLAGCQSLTYVEMMQETARRLGRKRYFVTVPVFTPTLSRLWVSLITNTPKALVYPLVQSLEHPMLARPDHLFPTEWTTRTYGELLEKASMKTHSKASLFRFHPRGKSVRSVQRLTLPIGKDATWIKQEYIKWLPQFLWPCVRIRFEGAVLTFSLFTFKSKLLELKLSEARSSSDRQLLYIGRGLLVAKENSGRIEFRVVLNKRYVLIAIHDYSPSLPWFIYRFTQAKVHLLIMKSFGRHIQRLHRKKKGSNLHQPR